MTDLHEAAEELMKVKDCALCGASLEGTFGHNGQPLTDGRVCEDCNENVIVERMMQILQRKPKKGSDDEVSNHSA